MQKNISSYTGLIKDGKYITVDIDTWLLVEYELTNRSHRIICNLLQERPDRLFLCIKMLEIGNSIYFIFRNSQRILEYNTVEQRIYNYGLEYEIFKNSTVLYNDAYYFEGKIIMFPCEINDPIIFFEIETKEYIEKGSIKQMLVKEGVKRDAGKIYTYVKLQNEVWFCIYGSEWLGCITLNNLNLRMRKCEKSNQLAKTVGGKDFVFFTEAESCRFFMTDKINGELLLYDVKDLELKEQELEYGFIVSVKKKIFAIPTYPKSLTIIDKETKEVINIKFPKEFSAIFKVRNSELPFVRYIVHLEKLYLIPFSCNGMLVVDMVSYMIQYYPLKLRDRDFFYLEYAGVSVVCEEEKFGLEDFIDIFEALGRTSKCEIQAVGKKIFQISKGG